MDIFISYNWGVQEQVIKLYEILTNLNYKVWIDIKQLQGGNKISSELAQGIKNAKIVISCITRDYCKSYHCNLEIDNASSRKKQIIPLMLENLSMNEIDDIEITGTKETTGIGFIINTSLYIPCYKNGVDWPNINKDEILKAVKTILEVKLFYHVWKITKNFNLFLFKKISEDNQTFEENLNDRYRILKKLGDGSQATVYQVEDTKEQNELKALKQFHPIKTGTTEVLKLVEKEIEILKELSGKSDYVINYLDSFVESTKIGMVKYNVYHIVNDFYQVIKVLVMLL